jgi:hypothetical protein
MALAMVRRIKQDKKPRNLVDLFREKLQKIVTLATKASTLAVLFGMQRRMA